MSGVYFFFSRDEEIRHVHLEITFQEIFLSVSELPSLLLITMIIIISSSSLSKELMTTTA